MPRKDTRAKRLFKGIAMPKGREIKRKKVKKRRGIRIDIFR